MRSRLIKTSLFLVLLAVAGAGLLWIDAQRFLNVSLTVSPRSESLLLKPGTTVRGLAHELHQREILDRPWYFQLFVRFGGQASRLQAGEYQIDTAMTPRELLALLVSGKVVQHQFTIVEGWNIRELLAAIAADPVLEQTLQGESSAERIESLMSALGRDGQHPEGRFLPDTYSFPRGTSDVAFLRRAARAMDQVLTELWPEREEGLPLKSAEEALILASIVEKETAVPDERPLIAGVFVNRLRKNMKLQTDPTVIYGIGENFDGNIRRRDLRRDTPYNTYTRKGLTPTPIAMAGRDAIEAVLHPDETKALFFVARGDGSHKFSRTLAEHEAAVVKYQLGGDASRLKRSSSN